MLSSRNSDFPDLTYHDPTRLQQWARSVPWRRYIGTLSVAVFAALALYIPLYGLLSLIYAWFLIRTNGRSIISRPVALYTRAQASTHTFIKRFLAKPIRRILKSFRRRTSRWLSKRRFWKEASRWAVSKRWIWRRTLVSVRETTALLEETVLQVLAESPALVYSQYPTIIPGLVYAHLLIIACIYALPSQYLAPCAPLIEVFTCWISDLAPAEYSMRAYRSSATLALSNLMEFLSNIDFLFEKAPHELVTEEFEYLVKGTLIEGSPFENVGNVWQICQGHVPPGSVRVKWYPDLYHVADSAACLTFDFPLDASGNLSLAHVRQRWGMRSCVLLDSRRGQLEIFQPNDPDVVSALAVRVLLDKQNCLRVIEQLPPSLQTIRLCRKTLLELAAPFVSNISDIGKDEQQSFIKFHGFIFLHFLRSFPMDRRVQ
ncbi:hypothetical protein EIP91_000665 [Steccherinum ochraceum]|uniref:Uncharacterized protein n=1 Tax=Steccherinum ochraceum TaxID=92696 RepID=A0A4R0RLW2_9APHY|nr:hypothetical protein EIP91_000665 [Steccherinum ochraceum]